MPRLLVVVNRAAGTTDDESLEAALTVLRSGADVTVAATADADDLRRAVTGRQDRRLVIVGGDGSVHAAVTALDAVGGLAAEDPIGIIPLGTGNDLGQALELPLDASESAAVVLTGTPRRLDLVRDNSGGVVVNAVHVGAGARAAAEAARFKDRLGPAAYPLGAAIAGVNTAGWDLRVEVDGRVVQHQAGGWAADGGTRVLMAAVCNGPSAARRRWLPARPWTTGFSTSWCRPRRARSRGRPSRPPCPAGGTWSATTSRSSGAERWRSRAVLSISWRTANSRRT